MAFPFALFTYLKTHKFISGGLGVIALGIIYALFFRSSGAVQTQYALAQVTRGTLVTSVSGTGQVSASNQIDIKPKVSGTYIYVNENLVGRSVPAGTLIAEIDPTDATKAVRDAQLSLQSAQLSLQKMQNDQASGQATSSDNLSDAQTSLAKAYQDGFNAVATAFIHLPDAENDARLTLYGTALSSSGSCSPDSCEYENLVDTNDRGELDSLITRSEDDLKNASISYTASFEQYKVSARTDDSTKLESLISNTLLAAQDLSQTIKNESTLLSTLIGDIQKNNNAPVPAAVTNYQNNLTNDLSTVNSQISSLLSIQNTITTDKQTIASTQRTISSSEQGNVIDLATQENTVAQRQAAVQDAQTTLAEYYIRAPFAGIISSIDAQKGLDSGSTAAATIISPKQVVEISLNEVDVANVIVGQPATMTFDAVPGLTLTGKVASIDTIGTATQGVVSYTVKITIDSQDPRIKPGMSASASIITQTKADVLEVPVSAIKTQGGQSYVELVNLPASSNSQALISSSTVPAPQIQPVTVGLKNDTMAEVSDGLKEGDTVITRTITPSSSTAKTTTTRTGSNAGFFGGGEGAGGAVRVLSK